MRTTAKLPAILICVAKPLEYILGPLKIRNFTIGFSAWYNF